MYEVSMIDGHIDEQKTSEEIGFEHEKIKAIHPHIVVGGKIDNPCYSIEWYDIEKQSMYLGYSSFRLEYVQQWLNEDFDVVDTDIENLINRQKAEIERLKAEIKFSDYLEYETINQIKTEAYKEFAERLKELIPHFNGETSLYCFERAIDHALKEMVGDNNGRT